MFMCSILDTVPAKTDSAPHLSDNSVCTLHTCIMYMYMYHVHGLVPRPFLVLSKVLKNAWVEDMRSHVHVHVHVHVQHVSYQRIYICYTILPVI